MSNITLGCFVIGDDPRWNAFPVDIDTSKDKTFGHLKNVIKETKTPEFDDIASKKLVLWKVDISPEELDKMKINNINIKDKLGGVKLPPLSKISDYFPTQPDDDRIHIIVEQPDGYIVFD